MPPSTKQMAKFQRALKEAAEVFDDVDFSTVKIPIESAVDLIREAASVIAYYDMREKFREEICRGCGGKFAYAYYTTSVKHCSIPCLQRTLEKLGLSWDPSKPYESRWGSRYIPAIVPAEAYAHIKEQAPPVETAEPEPKPVTISDDCRDIIARLSELTY